MKNVIIIVTLLALASAQQWQQPGPGDARSPCPGLNTLANHGILPRSGRGLTAQAIADAVLKAYAISPTITNLATKGAAKLGVFDADGTMSLDRLNITHNQIEHDASLTRQDKFLGDAVRQDPALIRQLLPDLDATLTLGDVAAARALRITDSEKNNPHFNWTLTGQKPLAAGESAFLTTIFGSWKIGFPTPSAQVPAKFLNEFLLYERLPTALGWSTRGLTITAAEFGAITTYFLAREFAEQAQLSDAVAHHAAQKAVDAWMRGE